MLRLLIDALSEPLSLALADGGRLIARARNDDADKAKSLALAFETLRQSAPEAMNIGEIVAINGPGNFTALRAAIGFARGLALGLDVPSRGIGVFEVDFALIHPAPPYAALYRDARGGRFYEAKFCNGLAEPIAIVSQVAETGFSAEAIRTLTRIEGDEAARMKALARLADTDIGDTPLKANYVRPPAAALPSEAPLVILDDH